MLIVYLCASPPEQFAIVLRGSAAIRTFLQRLRKENFTVQHDNVVIYYDEATLALIDACVAQQYTLNLYGSEVLKHGLPPTLACHVSQWIESSGRVARNYTGHLPPEAERSLSVLGLDRDELTEANVNKQYRVLALQHHPDKCGKTSEQFVQLTVAREVLLAHLAKSTGLCRQ